MLLVARREEVFCVHRRRWVTSFVAIGFLLTFALAFGQEGTDAVTYRLAELSDLEAYPDAFAISEVAEEGPVAVVLPGTKVAVILRPIPWEEYGSYQIQAVSHDIIERQMLAAAIVVPSAVEADIAGFSSELIALLQRQVNAISGYEVFSGLPQE